MNNEPKHIFICKIIHKLIENDAFAFEISFGLPVFPADNVP